PHSLMSFWPCPSIGNTHFCKKATTHWPPESFHFKTHIIGTKPSLFLGLFIYFFVVCKNHSCFSLLIICSCYIIFNLLCSASIFFVLVCWWWMSCDISID